MKVQIFNNDEDGNPKDLISESQFSCDQVPTGAMIFQAYKEADPHANQETLREVEALSMEGAELLAYATKYGPGISKAVAAIKLYIKKAYIEMQRKYPDEDRDPDIDLYIRGVLDAHTIIVSALEDFDINDVYSWTEKKEASAGGSE